MKDEAVVMTIDFGRNHFNAILLNRQLKLISANGAIISIRENAKKSLPEQTGLVLNRLIHFFKR